MKVEIVHLECMISIIEPGSMMCKPISADRLGISSIGSNRLTRLWRLDFVPSAPGVGFDDGRRNWNPGCGSWRRQAQFENQAGRRPSAQCARGAHRGPVVVGAGVVVLDTARDSGSPPGRSRAGRRGCRFRRSGRPCSPAVRGTPCPLSGGRLPRGRASAPRVPARCNGSRSSRRRRAAPSRRRRGRRPAGRWPLRRETAGARATRNPEPSSPTACSMRSMFQNTLGVRAVLRRNRSKKCWRDRDVGRTVGWMSGYACG